METMSWTDERLGERFDRIERRFEEQSTLIERRFDKRDVQIERRFDSLREELAEVREAAWSMQRATVLGSCGIIAGLIGVIGAIVTNG